jgi:hypothetical protein
MPRRWEPSAEDGMSLAAFRWFANTIENFAIELYATDRESFPEIERILRNTLKELRQSRKQFGLTSEDDCPDGYVLCHGVCAPSCDMEMNELAAPKSAGKTKDKGKKR